MEVKEWKIYWNKETSNAYMYGSHIEYAAKDEVIFENPFLPPGTVIYEWYSKTDYSTQKMEPSLPMIDGESKYRIKIHMESEGMGEAMIRLVFYDRYEREAGVLNLTEKEADFKCPLKTFSYRMQLINGGVKKIHFHNVVIQEITDET